MLLSFLVSFHIYVYLIDLVLYYSIDPRPSGGSGGGGGGRQSYGGRQDSYDSKRYRRHY